MPLTNNSSSLLSYEENNLIFSLLGEKCSSLATTVVERYIAGGKTDYDNWMYTDVGVICFVKDVYRRSYFFRIYCPNSQLLIWEHELYNFMEYFKLSEHLHAFEAEDCIVAFNFANIKEGDFFYNLVKGKLGNRGKPPTGNVRKCYDYNNSPKKPINIQVAPTLPLPSIGSNMSLNRKQERTKRKTKISKDMIGGPQNFVHLSHFGFDSTPNFNLLEDKQLQAFFEKAGVSENDLKDPDTYGFIYQFIEDHGGMEAVKSEVASVPPPFNRPSQHIVPIPPPSLPPCNIPPPPPMFNVPPPPPHLSNVPPPPPHLSNVPPPPPHLSNVPPPPPPPLSNVPPPPSISVSSPSGLAIDSKSALMESIRSGTTLKHVSMSVDNNHIDPSGGDSNESGGRGELLEQIRHGVKLHTITKKSEPTPKHLPVQGGLAAALANALAKRSTAIHSDSESATSSDNEEWDEE